MDTKKSYIPIKVLVSYLVLILLFGSVGWFLYSENKIFSKKERTFTEKKNSILKVSAILSDLHKTESLARIAIQSESEADFKEYTIKSKALQVSIDSLKTIVSTQYQIKLLDTVQLLLSKKAKNIQQLKFIKNKTEDEIAVSNAIIDLTKMESSMRKLQMEDFVKYPASMAKYERNVLKKYVAYLNQNIPDDSTNTLTKRESDSIVSVSKMLLNEVKKETANKKKLLHIQENKLLQNELLISNQLRKVFGIIEREIILNTTKSYLERENSLKKTNRIVTAAALVGLLLTLFFLILILNDFSKTELYKSQLEAATLKAKKALTSREQLIATVSHDLKTPLSTIMGYTELLSESDLNKKQLYFIKNIKGSSTYISKLVQDLLDFTQIEAGKITIDKIAFSLLDTINQIAHSIQSVHLQKEIELNIEIDPRLEKNILGDPFRLTQILSNIIGNAFKFTENGTINIQANANLESNTITILIKDSGIGIEEKNQQIIFEEFTQAHDQIERQYGGTGLGLTISKKMTALLGGQLNLKSSLGKGSIFQIEIPLLFQQPVLEKNKSTTLLIPPPVAIILDDDINLLHLITEVLKQNNYLVFPFSTATDALSWIEKNTFDIVITDIQMPVIDGFLFLEKLQEGSYINFKKQPVVAVTGRSDLNLEQYKAAGFTTVIRKPYTPKSVLNTLQAILNKENLSYELENQISSTIFSTKGYCLKELNVFLSQDKEAIKEILSEFMSQTNESLSLLQDAIKKHDFTIIKNTAHKMNPMFKQIHAFEISAILHQLEHQENSVPEITLIFPILKNKIAALFLLLNNELD